MHWNRISIILRIVRLDHSRVIESWKVMKFVALEQRTVLRYQPIVRARETMSWRARIERVPVVPQFPEEIGADLHLQHQIIPRHADAQIIQKLGVSFSARVRSSDLDKNADAVKHTAPLKDEFA